MLLRLQNKCSIAYIYPLLGRVALGAQWPIAIKLSRGRSVGRSVCPMHCRKTADRIRMPFGIIGRTGPGMRQVMGFGDRATERGTFGGDFGARRCNQWGLYFVATRPSSQITLDRVVSVELAENRAPIIMWTSTIHAAILYFRTIIALSPY